MALNLNKLAFLAWFTPVDGGFGLPLLFTGPPGQAKTAMSKGWAKHFHSRFLHLSPGQKGDGYFGVVPVPYSRPDGIDVVRFPVNEDIAKLCAAGRGLILVDELRSAPGIVRPALLGLLQERMFGDQTLPPGVRIFGASNATIEAVNGRPLSPPEANRLCHIKWPSRTASEMMTHMVKSSAEEAFADRVEPDYNDYAEFEAIEKFMLQHRQKQRNQATTEIFNNFVDRYNTTKGDALTRQPKTGSAEADGPWPSPRSWSNVVDVLATYRSLRLGGFIKVDGHESDDFELGELVRGCVGPLGGELMEWLRLQDIPDYALWLDGKLVGKDEVKFDAGRDDRTFVIMTGAANHILSLQDKPTRARRVEKFWEHCIRLVPIVGFEPVMAGAKLIMRNGIDNKDMSDISSKPGVKFAAEYRKLTQNIAAGGDGDIS
jgi:MoxR-like ATPase